MKSIYRTILAVAGSFLAAQFGGWDAALETLVCFMAIDWITGGVLLPVVFKKSPKSENGKLESRAGWKGLCRKGMMLFFVLVAEKLDQLTQTNYLRDAVCIGFILNEAVSILENAGLMGVIVATRIHGRKIIRSVLWYTIQTILPPEPMPARMQERSTREIFRLCRRIIT